MHYCKFCLQHVACDPTSVMRGSIIARYVSKSSASTIKHVFHISAHSVTRSPNVEFDRLRPTHVWQHGSIVFVRRSSARPMKKYISWWSSSSSISAAWRLSRLNKRSNCKRVLRIHQINSGELHSVRQTWLCENLTLEREGMYTIDYDFSCT